jgi:hypothetical protein
VRAGHGREQWTQKMMTSTVKMIAKISPLFALPQEHRHQQSESVHGRSTRHDSIDRAEHVIVRLESTVWL